MMTRGGAESGRGLFKGTVPGGYLKTTRILRVAGLRTEKRIRDLLNTKHNDNGLTVTFGLKLQAARISSLRPN
jgi:hypothetical protein